MFALELPAHGFGKRCKMIQVGGGLGEDQIKGRHSLLAVIAGDCMEVADRPAAISIFPVDGQTEKLSAGADIREEWKCSAND